MKKKISILTLFPEMFSALQHSIIGKAIEKNILDISVINIRDYSANKHKKCDDYAFGGGAGMLMMPQPICDCIDTVDPDRSFHRIYLFILLQIFLFICFKNPKTNNYKQLQTIKT